MKLVALTGRTIAAHRLAFLDECTDTVERFFSGGIEVLKSQTESMRALLEDLERQVSRQREALETLAEEIRGSYTSADEGNNVAPSPARTIPIAVAM